MSTSEAPETFAAEEARSVALLIHDVLANTDELTPELVTALREGLHSYAISEMDQGALLTHLLRAGFEFSSPFDPEFARAVLGSSD